MVILMAARASRTENQDAIDTAIVGMLADPKEVYSLSLSLTVNIRFARCSMYGSIFLC
jgi:hypothetical protein